jgi:hypothetical protein
MNGTDRAGFGGAMLWARILDLGKERGRRPRRRGEGVPGPRRSPIVYIFSGYRRRWLRVAFAGARIVPFPTEKTRQPAHEVNP